MIFISDNLLFIPDFSNFGPRMSNDAGLDGYSETGSFVCHNLVCNHLYICTWLRYIFCEHIDNFSIMFLGDNLQFRHYVVWSILDL